MNSHVGTGMQVIGYIYEYSSIISDICLRLGFEVTHGSFPKEDVGGIGAGAVPLPTVC